MTQIYMLQKRSETGLKTMQNAPIEPARTMQDAPLIAQVARNCEDR